MTPDEAAKAEAESIATRWVPAQMTARQGMVDDIARAIVMRHRLTDEAQAEARRLIEQCSRGTNAHPYCPGCGRHYGDGHFSWCPLSKFLAGRQG